MQAGEEACVDAQFEEFRVEFREVPADAAEPLSDEYIRREQDAHLT
ncbi:hypothetical protein [Streptomyces afghaniensis]|nr:hypothetical protein [Streptomyces afghaniensis]